MAKALKIARDDESAQYLPRIQKLVDTGRIREARALVTEALRAHPTEPRLKRWSTVLAPATTKAARALDIDRSADFRWLEDHADSYPDQWVAVLEGSLVAHAATLRELEGLLAERAPFAPVLLHRFH
jgi:hypothetical protein